MKNKKELLCELEIQPVTLINYNYIEHLIFEELETVIVKYITTVLRKC